MNPRSMNPAMGWCNINPAKRVRNSQLTERAGLVSPLAWLCLACGEQEKAQMENEEGWLCRSIWSLASVPGSVKDLCDLRQRCLCASVVPSAKWGYECSLHWLLGAKVVSYSGYEACPEDVYGGVGVGTPGFYSRMWEGYVGSSG